MAVRVGEYVHVPMPFCACCGECLGVDGGPVVAVRWAEDYPIVVQLDHDCGGRCDHDPACFTPAEVEAIQWLL